MKACHIEELLKADEFVQFKVFLNAAVFIFILEIMVLCNQLIGEAFHQFVLCVCGEVGEEGGVGEGWCNNYHLWEDEPLQAMGTFHLLAYTQALGPRCEN